jgi:hypothetical protein
VTVDGSVDSLYVKELAKKNYRGFEGLMLRGQHRIMYFADLNRMPWKNGHGSPIGFEYQVLDDALTGMPSEARTATAQLPPLYDMICAAADKRITPVGEWNTAWIVVHGEYRLNGVRVLEYNCYLPEFKATLAESK